MRLPKFMLMAACASCSSGIAQAAEWDTEQKAMGAVLATVTAVDFLQTRFIATHPEFYERNPIIGKHPSIGRVNNYFALSYLIGFLVLDALPSEYRTAALKAGIVLETVVVGHNMSIGVGLRF